MDNMCNLAVMSISKQ